MKSYEKVIAEACRIECEESTDKVFIVFEVIDPQYKQEVKKNWTEDIEYKLIGKNLILNDK